MVNFGTNIQSHKAKLKSISQTILQSSIDRRVSRLDVAGRCMVLVWGMGMVSRRRWLLPVLRLWWIVHKDKTVILAVLALLLPTLLTILIGRSSRVLVIAIVRSSTIIVVWVVAIIARVISHLLFILILIMIVWILRISASWRTPSVVRALLSSSAVGSIRVVMVRLVTLPTVRVVGRLVPQDASWLVLIWVNVTVASFRTAITVAIEADTVVKSANAFNIEFRVSLIVLIGLSRLFSRCRSTTYEMSFKLCHVVSHLFLINYRSRTFFHWRKFSSSFVCQFELDIFFIAPIKPDRSSFWPLLSQACRLATLHPMWEPDTWETSLSARIELGPWSVVRALSFSHGVALAMEVLSVLNMVYLGDELFFDRIASVQAVKRLANHHLQIVVRLFNLTDVNLLKLYRNWS